MSDDLVPLLQGSIEIARLKKQLGLLRLECDLLRDTNANLRVRLQAAEARLQSDFDLACDEPTSMFHKPQAG